MTVLPHFHRNCYHCRRFSGSRIIVGLNKISPMYACKNGGYALGDKSLRQIECLSEFLLGYPQIKENINFKISSNISCFLKITSNKTLYRKELSQKQSFKPNVFFRWFSNFLSQPASHSFSLKMLRHSSIAHSNDF